MFMRISLVRCARRSSLALFLPGALALVGPPPAAAVDLYPSITIAGVQVEIGDTKRELLARWEAAGASARETSGYEEDAWWIAAKDDEDDAALVTFKNGRLAHLSMTWSRLDSTESAAALGQAFLSLVDAYCQGDEPVARRKTVHQDRWEIEILQIDSGAAVCSMFLHEHRGGERVVELQLSVSAMP